MRNDLYAYQPTPTLANSSAVEALLVGTTATLSRAPQHIVLLSCSYGPKKQQNH
ncbi:predicted protein [Histoplasma capsulatum G186AR]|uniref:Uncharacterized protein n=1 Tax=Ajellomyces capsulatus (strain G186AR / H82 / ATCC MYA-2454 / RMSCC 2432) TaxID=447093 RepID=C0NRK2_AJECG|nr:uncharacterized protein HCBG_05632 [Histoplasma capsulatum G186AR]EEH06316.1 predicted protein [Histoplasma capsulatum G186AR]